MTSRLAAAALASSNSKLPQLAFTVKATNLVGFAA
jgi:hypothetical protein